MILTRMWHSIGNDEAMCDRCRTVYLKGEPEPERCEKILQCSQWWRCIVMRSTSVTYISAWCISIFWFIWAKSSKSDTWGTFRFLQKKVEHFTLHGYIPIFCKQHKKPSDVSVLRLGWDDAVCVTCWEIHHPSLSISDIDLTRLVQSNGRSRCKIPIILCSYLR